MPKEHPSQWTYFLDPSHFLDPPYYMLLDFLPFTIFCTAFIRKNFRMTNFKDLVFGCSS